MKMKLFHQFKYSIKKRNIKDKNKDNIKFVNLIGLDKITAKTFPIKIKLGETAKFGLLEIKALKCGISGKQFKKKNEFSSLSSS